MVFADIGKFFVVFFLPRTELCKGIMPKFNTSEWGVLGEGWEREWARSKQTRCSQQGYMLFGYGKLTA